MSRKERGMFIIPFVPPDGTTPKNHSRVVGRAVSLGREVSKKTSDVIKSRMVKRIETEERVHHQAAISGDLYPEADSADTQGNAYHIIEEASMGEPKPRMKDHPQMVKIAASFANKS